MVTVPVSRLRANLSETLDRVQRGDEVVLTRNGRPIVRLTPARQQLWRGLNVIAPETRRPPRVRPFLGTGTMSREILAERRRDV